MASEAGQAEGVVGTAQQHHNAPRCGSKVTMPTRAPPRRSSRFSLPTALASARALLEPLAERWPRGWLMDSTKRAASTLSRNHSSGPDTATSAKASTTMSGSAVVRWAQLNTCDATWRRSATTARPPTACTNVCTYLSTRPVGEQYTRSQAIAIRLGHALCAFLPSKGGGCVFCLAARASGTRTGARIKPQQLQQDAPVQELLAPQPR